MKHRLELNKNTDHRYINGAGKYQQELYQKRLNAYNLNPKYCLQCNQILDYKHVRKNTEKVRFCSRSCGATYNNSKRDHTTKGLMKTCQCVVCSSIFEISLHSSTKNVTCNACKPTKVREQKPLMIRKYICSFCNKEFEPLTKYKKTCSKECKKSASLRGAKKGGRKSVLSQQRRSKNEIYFYELCTTKFTNVLHNEQMFNGWDADVILPDLKIAVLWNGPWHYKKITQKHSLAQVQNRDKLKMKEIESYGYSSYVIQDMGIRSKKKVKDKFDIFCEWLNKKIAGVGIEPAI